MCITSLDQNLTNYKTRPKEKDNKYLNVFGQKACLKLSQVQGYIKCAYFRKLFFTRYVIRYNSRNFLFRPKIPINRLLVQSSRIR